ncbi:MAG: AAA family ATPase [Streptosporangiales bacterium]|nr:AAA family ATPase [Streptosporangiales bacterium]
MDDPFASAAPAASPFDTSASPFDAPPFEDSDSPAAFWQPQPDEDSHPTDALQRPAEGDQPGWPGGGQEQPAPWGAWPGEAPPPEPPTQHAQPQEPPTQHASPRYDLSQFQHGYQPPPTPQHGQGQPQPPAGYPEMPPPGQEQGQGQPTAGYPVQGRPQPPAGYPEMPPPGQPAPHGPPPGLPGPGQPPAIAAQWQQLPPQQPIPLTSDHLAPQEILRQRKAAPTGGWRRAVFKASGGLIDPGESNKEIQKQQMETFIRTPVAGGHYRVAVLSLKGGVGKTTTTVGLGSTLATLRGDRIIAVDANPDRGTLSEKVRLETRANVRDLLSNNSSVQRYSDVRQYTSQAASRLEVLASDPDPAISEAFSEDDYRVVADVLEHYYSICLTDCGTGLLHSAMRGVLGMADQIVLVSSASVDGARSASATLDWLDAHDYGDLVRTGVVVMSAVRPQNKAVDLSRLEQHFSARCRALVRIPFDPHLEAGAEFVLEQLSSPTADAYLELTAAVAAGFQHRLPR